MNGQTEITKLVQSELLGNISDQLKAIACLDDRAAPRISEIVNLVDELLLDMSTLANESEDIPPRKLAPVFTIV